MVARLPSRYVRKLMAPALSCVSIAESPPNMLFGKIEITTRPFESLLIFSAAAVTATVTGLSGCCALAYLSSNSAAAAGHRTKPIDANAEAAAETKVLR